MAPDPLEVVALGTAPRGLAVVLALTLLTGCATAGRTAATGSRHPSASSTAIPAPPAASWLRLSPPSGPPGTKVALTGHLAGVAQAPSGPQAQSGTVCWDGCGSGLDIQPTWHWVTSTSASGVSTATFATTFTVPGIPWLTAAGPHPLDPGTYSVGVPCLGPVAPGCALRQAQVDAVFRLTGVAGPSLCAPGQPCARLTLQPAAAAPGETVGVTGWAPLTGMFGSTPAGYSLVLSPGDQLLGSVAQSPTGAIRGSFVLPASVGGSLLSAGAHTIALRDTFDWAQGTVTRVTLAATAFGVEPPPTWAGLGPVHPLWVASSAPLMGGAVRAASPGASTGPVAVCAPTGGIRVTRDGGATWTLVPTAGVVTAAAGSAFVVQSGPGGGAVAACASALPDAAHPGSFYAAFDLVPASCDCAPPSITVAYETNDGGRLWRPVPPPTGFTAAEFGGFQSAGGAVVALFAKAPTAPGAGKAPTMAAVETTDGGRTWRPATLACPASGPCLRWGPRPSQILACMTSFPRAVVGSTDRGATWTARTQADECFGTAELAGLGTAAALLVTGQGNGALALRISRDGGRTWTALAVPPLPPPAPTDAANGISGLRLLPSGALAAPDGTGLDLLLPGASAWCPATGVTLPSGAAGLSVAGGRLWWTEVAPASGSGDLAFEPGSLPLTALACGGSAH